MLTKVRNVSDQMSISSAVEGDAVGSDVAGDPPFNPFSQIHRLLRGRYWLAVLLALVGGAGGAYIGYHATQPTYQSVGLIRIKPILPRILFQNDQNGAMPMFAAFVESQVALIKSQRVIDVAMQHPEWRALNRGLAPERRVQFSESLAAQNPRGSDMIAVTFTDADPDAARRGVVAIVDAYDRLYGENDSESAQSRMKQLEERRELLSKEDRQLNEQILKVSDAATAGAIEPVFEAQMARMLQLAADLQEAEVAVARGGDTGAGVGGAATTQPLPSANPVPVEILAMNFPGGEVARLVAARRDLESQLAFNRKNFGEQHRSVREGIDKLAFYTKQLDELAPFYQQLYAERMAASGAVGPTAGLTLEQLKANEANVRRVYERVKAETEALGRKYNEVKQLRRKVEEVAAKLKETNERIDQLNTEAAVGGRISIESRGDRPLAPFKDKRKMFAVAGAMGLGGGGVALLLLIGLLDRRIRHISDVHETIQHCRRILGVLPQLPNEDSDMEDSMIAAHSVHQIRMLLQNRVEPGRTPVFAVTSASPSAGKTSLTLALGISFAASGARTLLIDCDMIGGGLTARMKKGSRRRIGYILRRLGLVSTEQLVVALKESRRLHERIGDTLVRQQLVTAADVAHALEVQRHEVVGLREALLGDPPNECITGAGVNKLFLMPLGSASRQHAAQLSYASLLRLVTQLRGWFDVILIDTGPILGSLEASVVVKVADDVVLTVARGEHHPLVNRAVEHLQAAGARLAGLVLNRVSIGDIVSSGMSSSTSRRSIEASDRVVTSLAKLDHHTLRLGPISTAVVGLAEFDETPQNYGD
jgi:Mrp family chromosome partitioning ATPase